jgi:heptosyltransferase III
MNCRFKDIHRILVIKLRHIGDVLLSVPVFRAVRETFGDVHISALVNAGTEEVLQGNPLVDELISFDRQIKRLPPLRRTVKEASFLMQIRKRGFDMTVDLTGGDRAAVLSLVSGARYRLGWKDLRGFPGKRYLYTHLSVPNFRNHVVLQNLDVVRQCGIDTKNLSVGFYIPDSDRAFVGNLLKKNIISGDTAIVHVHPTSRWLFKCWRDKYMAEVIGWLLEHGTTVMVTSSPEKQEIKKAKEIMSLVSVGPHASRLIDLIGKTTLKQLGAISEASTVFFGVDSAPMHIAAAVGTPVVALFGPSGTHNWGPWDNSVDLAATCDEPHTGCPTCGMPGNIKSFGRHTVLQSPWDCVPCGQDGCEGSKLSKCLEAIRPEEVEAILTIKLKAYGPTNIQPLL